MSPLRKKGTVSRAARPLPGLLAPDPIEDRVRTGSGVPLPARMRPRSFEEYVGQSHIVGPGTVLRKSIEADRLPSIVLWGPPGTGKTTLARLIASVTRCRFAFVSAVSSGVAELRKIVSDAREMRGASGTGTILFIDEVHRFNKAQQDAILPFIEDATVTLIGATTENPSFEVTAPLLSRARVFALKALSPDDIRGIVRRALADMSCGLGDLCAELTSEAEALLLEVANGDARVALNALELAAYGTECTVDGRRVITVSVLEDAVQSRALRYDKSGDEHYDTISAFIKSVRGSDPDASVYWLARMLEAGEDPLFVVRRLVILAAEDVGLADPQALGIAVAAQQAVQFIGMPEGFLPMTEATIYLATAPKSNSVLTAYRKASGDVRQAGNLAIPLHLRNATTGLAQQLNYGQGYRYAHDHSGHQVEQQYLPDSLETAEYYSPGDQGFESEISRRLEKWGKRNSARRG